MKKLTSVFGIVLMLLLVFSSTAAAAPPEKVNVIIGFDRTPGSSEQGLVRGFGGEIMYAYNIIPAIAASIPETAIQGLSRNPRVTVIEPDVTIHTIDAELDNSWGVKRIGAGIVHSSGNKGSEVKVAIIDSGVDYNHPELQDNYLGGYDFVNDDNDPMDDNGHGTHVAGIIAALDNDDNNSVVGVAPDVKIYALKVLDADGNGSFINVIAALDWVCGEYGSDPKAYITNNSYGSLSYPGDLVKWAFDFSYDMWGVLHVAAAGNSGNPGGGGYNVEYPGRFGSVVAVAATDQNDTRASFSSTGRDVELAAPGVNILSTYLNGGLAIGSGTSMASPHAAGTAALVMAAYPSWTNAQVRAQLRNTADDLGSTGKDNLYGYGLVDADEAAPSTNVPPDVAITDPVSGATISGTYRIKVSASDSDGAIAKVELSIDAATFIDITANSNGTSYYYDWDTTAVTDGSHTIDARAMDNSGVTVNAAQVTVSIDNVDESPVVNITSPANDDIVSGTIVIRASASDDRGVSMVDFYINEVLLATDTTAPYECSWDTTLVTDGPHVIKAIVTDTTSQTAQDIVDVTVDNTIHPDQIMHVKDLDLVLKIAGINTSAQAATTVVNTDDNPVSGATVSGYWTDATYDSDSGITDANGQIILESNKVKKAKSGTTFTFVIYSIIKDGWTYDASVNGDFNGDGINGDTSNSIVIP